MDLKKKKIFKLFKEIIIILFILIFFSTKKNIIAFKNSYSKYSKTSSFYIKEYFKNVINNNVYFKQIDMKYTFSFKFNIIRLEYKFAFYNENISIFPSDLILNTNINIFCYIEIININISINSLPNISENKYYKCVEYYKLNEKTKFGIKIYQIKETESEIEDYKIFFFNEKLININNINLNNDIIYEPYILNKKYESMIKKMNDKKINETLKLKKSYIKYPLFQLKRIAVINENNWKYGKIYNDYFCFCKGLYCLNLKFIQKCKYNFYLNIIDINRYVFNKTDFLFIDFILSELSSDDAYPIFKEMFKRGLPVHYLTENMEIFNEFCHKKNKCLSIVYVNKDNFTINGDFLERHLSLFLKLKSVISGGGTYFNYINNLFYNIEYITYISITHGVCYFKKFLYEDYSCYGPKRIDKILIPPIKEIFEIAKSYGWKDKDIIKINLPKWDNYSNKNKTSFSNNKNEFKTNSIFIFFTWREIKKYKKISKFYIENIKNLIKHDKLKTAIKNKNITMYFTFHHKIDNFMEFEEIFKKINYLKFIKENEISQCLIKTSLVITDFSSIIFDLIYRKKPFIIYIPDANDPNIENIYNRNYYELIQSMKNETIKFKNKYFNINEAVNKIIYYINNNFKLDSKLKLFYDSFGFKMQNSIDKFVYLKNLK